MFSVSILMKGVAQKKVSEKDVKRLFSLMAGKFSSQHKSKKDSAFIDVRLSMQPIWQNTGYCLCVEQALITDLQKPYRQRVPKLNLFGDSAIESVV